MGDDYNVSDCSWKKMVIAKTDNAWISTIKSEQMDNGSARNATDISKGGDQTPFSNVKIEMNDVSAEDTYQDDGEQPTSMIQEADPLGLLAPAKRTRRKGSGPKNETPIDRAARLAKMSAYAAQRLANETQEQRAVRLKRMSDYAAKRLSQETSEQRAKRLARMSAYAAKRLAEESPEQRRNRLARMSAYAAKRQAMKKVTSPSTSERQISNNSNFNPHDIA